MLQKLNSRIQGWFAWIFISIIAFTFAIFGIEHYIQSRSENIAKAEINGRTITAHEFDISYRRSQNLREPNEERIGDAVQKRKQELLDVLIKKNLVLESALSNGFFITNNQTNAAIQTIPAFLSDGHFSSTRYQQTLNQALFTPESFQAEVWENLLSNQQRFAFMGTAFALPSEVAQFVRLINQTRDYNYLIIPAQIFIPNIQIPEADITAYYQKNHGDFKSKESVSLEYVRLSMPQMRAKINVTEKQVKQYYEENKSNYVTPAKWQVAHIFLAFPPKATPVMQQDIEKKANDIYQKLQKSAADFETLVKTQSDDKLSALKEGVLPWIVAGQSEFAKSLMDLTTVGKISAPVKTAHGYEIFKLLAYAPAKTKDFDDVEQDIKNGLIQDKVQLAYAQALEQLADLSYQSPDTLEPIAETLQLNIEKTEPFTQEGGHSEITKNKNVLQVVFNPDFISQGNNSDPIQLDTDTVIVFRIANHTPAAQKSLSEVKADINALLVKTKAVLKARQLGEQILALNGDPAKENALLDAHQLRWQTIKDATRDKASVSPEINQLAFKLGAASAMMGDNLKDGGYALVRILKVTNGQMSHLTSDEIAQLTKKIEERHGALEYDMYMMTLLKQAKIVRY
jgi:peptidyl-prolyl cis-trans isomerase D